MSNRFNSIYRPLGMLIRQVSRMEYQFSPSDVRPVPLNDPAFTLVPLCQYKARHPVISTSGIQSGGDPNPDIVSQGETSASWLDNGLSSDSWIYARILLGALQLAYHVFVHP